MTDFLISSIHSTFDVPHRKNRSTVRKTLFKINKLWKLLIVIELKSTNDKDCREERGVIDNYVNHELLTSQRYKTHLKAMLML